MAGELKTYQRAGQTITEINGSCYLDDHSSVTKYAREIIKALRGEIDRLKKELKEAKGE